jgi:hypothetical protein
MGGISMREKLSRAKESARKSIQGNSFASILPQKPKPPPVPPAPPAPPKVPSYNPPPPVIEEPAPVQGPTKANMAGEVAKCSALLREMYALDLVIYGMEMNVDDDVPDRIAKEKKANAMFIEIRRMVNIWRSASGALWKPEERLYIEEICGIVEKHKGRVYPEDQVEY